MRQFSGGFGNLSLQDPRLSRGMRVGVPFHRGARGLPREELALEPFHAVALPGSRDRVLVSGLGKLSTHQSLGGEGVPPTKSDLTSFSLMPWANPCKAEERREDTRG